MKVLLTVGFIVGVVCGNIQAQSTAPDRKEEAKRAFASGFDYYLWYQGKEPVSPEAAMSAFFGTVLAPNIEYHAKDEKVFTPYKLRMEAHALNETDKKPILFSTTTDTITPKTQIGTEGAIFVADKTKLSGPGYLEAYLIETQTNTVPRHLSNTIRVFAWTARIRSRIGAQP